jgi:predicted RNase H-like HicB family nuclease
MLTRYIRAAMNRARFKTLDDGTYFGEIPGLGGVWANEATVETCREVLQEVLEEWLLQDPRQRSYSPPRSSQPVVQGRLSDGQADFPERINPAFPQGIKTSDWDKA